MSLGSHTVLTVDYVYDLDLCAF